MLKTFYIQTQKDTNKITDTCETETALKLGYIDVTLDTPLPPKINCGCYKYENNSIIYVPEWDKNEVREEIDRLNKEVVDERKANNIRLQNLEKDNLNLCEAVLNMQYQQDLKELGVK